MRNKIENFILELGKSFMGVVAMLLLVWLCVTIIIFLMYSVILDNEPLKQLLE
jgi:hypothetical protein